MSRGRPLSRRSFVAGAATAATVLSTRLGALASATPAVAGAADWKAQGVIDLSRSPHTKLHTVPVRAVTLHDSFWQARRVVNVQQSLPTMYRELEEHGRMDNFLRLVGKSTAPQRGPVYSDSDIYKWAEAASFAQQSGGGQLFHDRLETLTAQILAVQEPSGYLNTYFAGENAARRMTPQTQTGGHELYCIGHLIQAAVAQYRATGDRRLLECCLRFVDGYLIPGYGPEASKTPIVAGHPEIEMALIELYRVTGERRYLTLAGYILEGDKRVPLNRGQIVYMYCGIPFTTRTRLEGHAVRAMYACCGATDYFLETGDERYGKTLGVLTDDLLRDQMYVNGGVGAREAGEAFGEAYELPNASAYGESCAAIGNMMWNWRMLHATADARHADVMERALYNGINSGMSLSGTTYCYRNPLAYDASPGETPIRNAWYDTTCCPPNLERTFASLPGYFYSTAPDGVYVHLFGNSTLDWHLESGMALRIEQQTGYPWSGEIRLTLHPAHPAAFTLYLRVPGWADSAQITVAGKPVANVRAGSYLPISRTWQPGATVTLSLDMTPKTLVADSRITDDQGRAAVQRGPVLYCLEDPDQAHGSSVRDLRIALGGAGKAGFGVKHQAELLGGVDVLEHPGIVSRGLKPAQPEALYAEATAPAPEPATLTFIPYYAWANREQAGMQVWVGVQEV